MIDPEILSPLPQLKPLIEMTPELWDYPEVVAVWLGGSVARGKEDRYSDVDLRIAVVPGALEEWRHIDVNTLFAGKCVAHILLPFGERAFLHHLVLESGDIYDVWIQSSEEAVQDASPLILSCRDGKFADKLRKPQFSPPLPPQPAEGETVRQLLESFWINTHKHRKALHRGLHLLVQTGIHNDRQLLLRLWYIQATGNDCGEMRTQTIHGLTHLMQTVEQTRGEEALNILGASLTSRKEICRAIEQLRDQVTLTGKILADSVGFAYPEAMEHVARQGWQEFMEQAS